MAVAHHFMVDFSLPQEPSASFLQLVPYQEAVISDYLSKGKLINYAISEEKSKIWAVFSASSEVEVLEMLIDFPLTKFMKVEISLLQQYNCNTHAPIFSMN
ncbi:MAG: hypothetical protein KTR30_07510 [Saprospiraceae bacterium]|nr:hypothetical protein [Saprospiraceae bacterium]